MADTTPTPYVRPSRITIPPAAIPEAQLVFHLAREQGVTYNELSWRSGLLVSTIKGWRRENYPSLQSLQAALGSLGWGLAPYPLPESLPEHVREQAEELGQHFFRDDHALAAAVVAATTKPSIRAKDGQPAPRLVYGMAA